MSGLVFGMSGFEAKHHPVLRVTEGNPSATHEYASQRFLPGLNVYRRAFCCRVGRQQLLQQAAQPGGSPEVITKIEQRPPDGVRRSEIKRSPKGGICRLLANV